VQLQAPAIGQDLPQILTLPVIVHRGDHAHGLVIQHDSRQLLKQLAIDADRRARVDLARGIGDDLTIDADATTAAQRAHLLT